MEERECVGDGERLRFASCRRLITMASPGPLLFVKLYARDEEARAPHPISALPLYNLLRMRPVLVYMHMCSVFANSKDVLLEYLCRRSSRW